MKRSLGIVLSLILVLTFTVMSTGQADAKSKTKVIYLNTSSTITSGDGDSTSTTTTKINYNKYGLRKSLTSSGKNYSSKLTYKRNKKGAPTFIQTKTNGKITNKNENTVNKKGLVTKSKVYAKEKGKWTHTGTYSYKYFGNGNLKKSSYKSKNGKIKYTTTLRKDGTIIKQTTVSPYGNYSYNYDKNGHQTDSTYKTSVGSGKATDVNTVDKKGNLIKQVETDVFTDSNGTKMTTIRTKTYDLTYDKHGNIVKEVSSIESVESDGSKYTYSSTTTSTYKKFKVPQKYLKYIQTPASE